MVRHHSGMVLLLFGLTGCASVDLNAGFPAVSAAVEERAGTKIVWNSGTELDQEVEEKLRALRQRKLTADDAVQIAMLNNRDLQAIYTELGVAQADLVQAGLFRNPLLDAAVQFPLSGRSFGLPEPCSTSRCRSGRLSMGTRPMSNCWSSASRSCWRSQPPLT